MLSSVTTHCGITVLSLVSRYRSALDHFTGSNIGLTRLLSDSTETPTWRCIYLKSLILISYSSEQPNGTRRHFERQVERAFPDESLDEDWIAWIKKRAKFIEKLAFSVDHQITSRPRHYFKVRAFYVGFGHLRGLGLFTARQLTVCSVPFTKN